MRRITLGVLAVVCWTIPAVLGGQPGNALAFGTGAQTGAAAAQDPVTRQDTRRFVLGDDGLLLATEDRATEMRVHGYLMGDGRLFATDLAGDAHEVFLFRRLRPLVEGTLARRFAYRFMPDFGQGNAVIQEVYLETTRQRAAAVRAGKFKAPIGLEVMR